MESAFTSGYNTKENTPRDQPPVPSLNISGFTENDIKYCKDLLTRCERASEETLDLSNYVEVTEFGDENVEEGAKTLMAAMKASKEISILLEEINQIQMELALSSFE